MSEVTLVRGPDPVGIRRFPDLRRYDVFVDGERVGHVESSRSPSYRKVGRLRAGLIGHPKTWHAYNTDRVSVGLGYTRADAVRALLRRRSA